MSSYIAAIDHGTTSTRCMIFDHDGKIAAVGDASTPVPSGYRVVEARGRYVTPGVIDVHSHLGVYPSPGVSGMSDGNEATSPNTAQVWAEHSLWPQDPGFNTARAGGVTTMHILPGSANLFGGRGVTIRNVPSITMQGMKFPGAPYGLKMACGENPKRVYGSKNRQPSTRMGNVAGYRAAFIAAREYKAKWDKWREDGEGSPPTRNLQNETLSGVLDGSILIQNHCYRADEMALVMDMAKEMGYKVAVVGATGNVGREMLGILAERGFPADEVIALASRRSVGIEVSYGDRTLKVKALEHYDFSDIDICLMSAGGSVSKEWSPKIGAQGAMSAARMPTRNGPMTNAVSSAADSYDMIRFVVTARRSGARRPAMMASNRLRDMAAACGAILAIHEEGLVQRAAAIGEQILPELRRITGGLPPS